jgi:hypothetical protein
MTKAVSQRFVSALSLRLPTVVRLLIQSLRDARSFF